MPSKMAPSAIQGRMPLQSRNPNTMGPQGSFTNSSTGEYDSKEMGLNRVSTLESSNNENNKGLTHSGSYAGNSRREHNDVREGAEPNFQPSTRSSSVPRPSTTQRSSSMATTTMDEESVIIEEKRRKVNGDGYTLHRYLRGRMLGKGGFAKVYLCTALDTNKAYAVKIVPKANLVKARARQKLQAEIKIHRTLKHKNVCEYKHFFEDRQNCYILLELCHNQSLNETIKRRKRLTEPETAYFMKQILQAVQYLHCNLVIHRDLKLGNLFLDRNMLVKVGDLGLATKLESVEEKRKTICGTPNYIAPEVIQGDRATRGHSFEVDVWSMGVIMYTLLIGKPPYEAKDVKATYQRILANEYSFPRDASISDDAKDLIRSMLQSKPIDRPSLEEMAVHPFFTSHFIPLSLPSSATHVAPKFEGIGDDVFAGGPDSSSGLKKPMLPRSSSQRRPFTTRDCNIVNGGSERFERSKPSKPTRETIEMHDAGSSKNVIASVVNVAAKSPAQPAFQVFDENENSRKTPSFTQRQQTRAADDDIVSRAAAMSIRAEDASPFQSGGPSPREALVSPATGSNSPENDMFVLHNMIDRIETVLDITARRTYSSVNPDSPSLTAFSRGGPTKWVSRYVDYTSKYGLGFLLNDGSSGVYFNDSTKTVLEAEGDGFQYIERKKQTAESPRRAEPVITSHSLTSYPDDLQKKVTLLKHFRNYLIEQQRKTGEGDYDECMMSPGGRSRRNHAMVYLKKWVRTKHAIFFRLSDSTVQIVFYDHTEVLLTSDERHITYVDKNRHRNTYYLTDELVGCNPEIAKRLKYTKEILQQLVSGQKR